MRALLIVLFLFPASMFAGTASATTFKVTASKFTHNNARYRRGGAENALLASIGVKKDPVVGLGYFLVKDFAPSSMTIHAFNATVIRAASISKASGSGGITYMGASARVTHDRLRSGEYKLMKIMVPGTQLARDINHSSVHLRRLKALRPKNKRRTISEVWIVLKASEVAQFGTNVSVKYNGGTWAVAGSANATKWYSLQPGGVALDHPDPVPGPWDRTDLGGHLEGPLLELCSQRVDDECKAWLVGTRDNVEVVGRQLADGNPDSQHLVGLAQIIDDTWGGPAPVGIPHRRWGSSYTESDCQHRLGQSPMGQRLGWSRP